VAGGSVAPRSITQNYKDAYVQDWNFNVQQEMAGGLGVMLGYFGSKGTHLNIVANMNQTINGVKPYPVLSASSPIFPSKALSNILLEESVANSSYNGLWLTVTKRLSKGLQLNGSYTYSKSLDDNSRNNNITTSFIPQNSYDIRNEWGPSDYDARHRFSMNGIYDLPFKGNKLVEGWEITTVVQLQTGNPLNFHTSNAAFTGLATLRPSITGAVQTGFTAATNKSAAAITYIQNPGVFFDQGAAYGNLGRNAITGPGFSNIDFALIKNTHITERINWRIEASAFDLLNKANWGNPGLTIGSSSLGLITSTRFTAGDFGTSRQIQLAMKLMF
jgi:hypothetical protein